LQKLSSLTSPSHPALLEMSAPQSLLGTGGGNVTCLSSGVFPSNAVTGPTIAATQPALGLNSSLSPYQLTNQMVPALTNHIVASTPPRLATSLNSSLSPATGISPLRPSPVLSLSPISPALGAQALGHSQQLNTAAQVSFTRGKCNSYKVYRKA
jgi:hypothetical protein